MFLVGKKKPVSVYSSRGFIDIVFSDEQFARLHEHLFRPDEEEQGAYAFAAPVQNERGELRLLVHHMIFLNAEHFAEQTPVYLELRPEVQQEIARMVLDSNWSLIEIHSHPFAHERVAFSEIDNGAATPRFKWFRQKMDERGRDDFFHVMLVFGHDSADSYMYDPQRRSKVAVDRVTITGAPMRYMHIERAAHHKKRHPRRPEPDKVYAARFDRQVLAFGQAGQQRVAATTVGIVGLGGMGSDIAYQLALLGVRRFVLVDHDTVETSNLNRFVGGRHGDAGKPKVDVVKRAIEEVDPDAEVFIFQEQFPTADNADLLKTVDVLFGCVDNDGARLLLNQFAVQYLLPYMDAGVGIETDEEGNITESGGQYRVVLPGGFCLECIRAINPVRAREDLLSPEQRELHKERGYIPTEDIHAPAVGFLNGILASLVVGEFLNLLTGFRPPGHLVYYFLRDQSTRTIKAPARLDCVVCNPDTSRRAHGDLERITGLPEDPGQVQAKLKSIPAPAPDQKVTTEAGDAPEPAAEAVETAEARPGE